jgi:hypothetical protein
MRDDRPGCPLSTSVKKEIKVKETIMYIELVEFLGINDFTDIQNIVLGCLTPKR